MLVAPVDNGAEVTMVAFTACGFHKPREEQEFVSTLELSSDESEE